MLIFYFKSDIGVIIDVCQVSIKLKTEDHISNFDSEIVLGRSRFDFPSMVIAIVRRHLALLLEKKRVEGADG